MKKIRHVLLIALATSFILPAIAEEQSPIIVTATRTAQTVDSSLASVTVITKEQIQKQQANDLLDLLSSLAGIDMVNSGGFGKSTSLYMRGTNTGHVLVMVDGVQVGSATLGQAAYQDIPVDLIERIEVVRGARASLYGSEAIGGVIQIFTRRPTKTTNFNFSSSMGSYNTKKNTAGISGKLHKTSLSVQASTFSTDGYNARQNNNPDIDGYKQNSANIFVKHEFNNTDNIEFSVLHSTNINHSDSNKTADDYSEGLQQVVGLKGTFTAMPSWLMTLKANQSKDDSDIFEDTTKTSVINTKREIYTWQNDITINENNLFTLGAENNDTSISGTSSFVKKSRNNKAIFIQNNWSKDDNNLLISARTDDNESFGKHTTGNIAWGQKTFNDINLVLSAATAFKAPSFNDLYYPDSANSSGNPNLVPEESESFEFSIKRKKYQLNFYRTTIKNLIEWSEPTGTGMGKWTPSNVASVKITGVEFLSSVMIDGWVTQINLGFNNPIDTATGKVLANRSRESLRLDFDKSFSNYALGATIKSQGVRYTSTTPLESYTLIDLRASYNISKDWDLKGKITNALEKKYTLNTGYNTPGKSIFVSIHYNGF